MSARALSTHEGAGLFALRRARALAGPRQLRLVASAFFFFMMVEAVRIHLLLAQQGQPVRPVVVLADLLVYAAFIVGFWRPLQGAAIASVPLVIGIVWAPTTSDAFLMALLACLVVARSARKAAIATVAAFTSYIAVRGVRYHGEHLLAMLVTLGGALILGTLVGVGFRVVEARRQRSEAALALRAREDARIRADERRMLARELHDVVVHQVSNASLQVMGHRGSDDPTELHAAMDKIDHAHRSALTELRLLVHVLRDNPDTAAGTAEVLELSHHLPPTVAASNCAMALIEHGFEPDMHVPKQADRLEMTVQRTIRRILSETTKNIIKHAPPKSRCSLSVSINKTQVVVRITNPLGRLASTPAELGWGLRGLRERVDLTGGTFSAGPRDGNWFVSVTLPHD